MNRATKPETGGGAPLGGWRRHDTLALRLFLLMVVTLVASHLAAYFSVVPTDLGGGAGEGRLARMPPLTSLPPADIGPAPAAGPAGPGGPPPDARGAPPGPFAAPPDAPPPPANRSGGPPALPAGTLWLDYLVRFTVIAIGAALGARWLAAPMRRLSRAAGALAQGLPQGQRPPPLDERRGSAEMREAAGVFNHMAERLAEQFDARSLHMAAVSHDLRTPLTRLRMRLEALDAPSATEAIADIHEMNALIDSSLAVLREQRDDVPAEPIDLAALVQALVDDLAEQGQAVTADALPPARVRAHPAALRRIVGNLLGNALRYGQRARIGLRPAGPRVELWIDDDGPGIPPERIEHAFEPWRRLGTPGAGPAGHGLGLAIARDLAERDGATLTLANRPEGGLRAQLLLRAA